MAVNGDAVRGVEPAGNIRKQGWGYMTQKGNKLFLHVYNKPINNILRVEFGRKTYVPGGVFLLKDHRRLKVEDAGRNKKNNRLFNIYLPEGMEVVDPFVVEVELINNTGDKDAYQQAKV